MAPTTTRKRPVMTGLIVTADEEIFVASTRKEAIEILKFVSAPDAETVFPCGWEVRLTGDRLPREIDFPSDMYGSCNAPAVGTEHGFRCLAGHDHVSYTSDTYEQDLRDY